MTQRNWLGNSGTFSVPGNWDTGVPGPGDAANFNAGTYTVTVLTSDTLDNISSGATATFDLVSGNLVLTGLANVSSWNGQFAQTAGTLTLPSGSFRTSGTLTQTGGTIAMGVGVQISQPGGTATFDGTLIGGTLAVGGSTTLNNAVLLLAAITMGSTGVLTLASSESFAGDDMIGNGSLVLGGNTLTLTGNSTQTGGQIFGPGAISVAGGTLNLSGSVIMHGAGGMVLDAGLINDDTGLTLGNATGDTETISIAAAGTYNILNDRVLTAYSNAGTTYGTIINQGLLEKTVAVVGARATIGALLINTGSLHVSLGTLLLNGIGSQLGGTIDGPGTLMVGGTATLTPGVVFGATTTLAVGFGGALVLGGSGSSFLPNADIFAGTSSTISLAGNTLSTQGTGSLNGTILAGGGTLIVGGGYDINGLVTSGGTLTLLDAGLMTQTGGFNLGLGPADHVAFQINAGARFAVTGATPGISTFNSGTTLDGLILNNGVFQYGVGGNNYAVNPLFANNITGTLLVAAGTVNLTQGLVNDGVGTVDGLLRIGGAGTLGGLRPSTGNFGTLTVRSGGTISVTGPIAAKSTIDFSGAGGVLIVNTPSLFAGTITNFGAGDTIVLTGVLANTEIYSAGLESMINRVSGIDTQICTVTFASGPLAAFPFTGDGAGDTLLLGTAPPNSFVTAFNTPVTIDTFSFPTGSTSENYATAARWSVLSPPSSTQDALISSAGGTLSFNAAAVVHSLTSSGTTLNMTGGRLTVNAGGSWANAVQQTGGVIESVTGFSITGTATTVGTSGVLQSDSGTLSLAGTVIAAGSLIGPGAISAGGGTFTTVPGVAITVSTLFFSGSETFNPYAGETLTDYVVFAGSTMPLFKSSVTFAGNAQLNVTVPDSGTVVIAAKADASNFIMNGTNDLVTVTGTGIVVQTSGNVSQSGTGGEIDISSGAIWNIQSDQGVFLKAGANRMVNSGLFEKTAGVGTSAIQAQFVNTGTMMVATGTLALTSGAIELAGTVVGAGMLVTGSPSGSTTTTLDAGLFVNVGTLVLGNTVIGGDQNYLGTLNSTQTIALQGHTFTLGNQAELAGGISGPGVLSLTRQADINGLTVQGNGVTLAVGNALAMPTTVTESANLVLGASTNDHATLAIAAGKTYALMTDDGVFGTFGGVVVGTIVNAGVFEKLGGVANGASSVVQAALVNTGTVLVQHGSLVVQTAATNDATFTVVGDLVLNAAFGADAGQTGTIVLMPTGTLIANANVAANQTVTYDPGGLIAIAPGVNFAATIQGFAPGDTIELTNTSANGVSYSGGVITITNTVGQTTSTIETLVAPGLSNPAGLTLSNDGSSGAGNTYLVELACFAVGTHILTTSGETRVEALKIGDLVPTLQGTLRPITWIGQTTIDLDRHPAPDTAARIRVAPHAFAPNVPHRPLFLSPDHAVHAAGALIPVHLLENGQTIARMPATGTVRYFHIELATHAIILAEGLPAESYLDTGNRGIFDGAETPIMHPNLSARSWDEASCVPLLQGGERVAAEKLRLLDRAAPAGVKASYG